MDDFLKKNQLKVHFIGIGGVNMSALAEYLFNNGFIVSGSDRSFNEYCERLTELGVTIYNGHAADNVKGADIVVVNSAIDENNEEIIYAVNNKIPVYKRAQLLKMIASLYGTKIGVSGSHGKTTVTALVTHILDSANKKFTAFIGGSDRKFDNYFTSGKDVFLSEVCEYKKNIDSFDADIAVTLNIDNDHLDSYNGFSDLTNSFFSYLDRAKTRIINADDKTLEKYRGNYVSFGFGENADYRACSIKEQNITTSFTVMERDRSLFKIRTKLKGEHNILNILAAVAVARTLNLPKKNIADAIDGFEGVKRRNEFIGYIGGAKCYADYAHHPRELAALIKSSIINIDGGKVYFVFQPHTFSRTKILFNEFVEVLAQLKNLYIYKTYAARERPEIGYSAAALGEAVKNSIYFEDFKQLIAQLKQNVVKGDTVYFVGAGDIYELAKLNLDRKSD